MTSTPDQPPPAAPGDYDPQPDDKEAIDAATEQADLVGDPEPTGTDH